MTNDAQTHINQIKNQSRISYLDISNRDLVGAMDLKGFVNLKSLNSYNNQFENLEGLNSLTAKDKLQKLNFYGNNIKEVDFAVLLNNFPNLQYLNIENNPVSATNLQKLSKDQLKNLVGKIKEKKFRVNSYKGTVLQDLLFFLQSSGNTVHAREIATMIGTSSVEKSPVRNSGRGWLIGGGIGLFCMAILAIGYWIGKRNGTKYNQQSSNSDDD